MSLQQVVSYSDIYREGAGDVESSVFNLTTSYESTVFVLCFLEEHKSCEPAHLSVFFIFDLATDRHCESSRANRVLACDIRERVNEFSSSTFRRDGRFSRTRRIKSYPSNAMEKDL